MDEHTVDTPEALRGLYAQPGERAVRKQLAFLDPHDRRFVGLSPFLVISSSGADGTLDASPRGGAPGFVKVDPGGRTLWIPDAPGNNRLDTLENIVATGRVGLLFLIPGIDETLRVNGRATLTRDPALVAACADARRAPKLVIRVAVEAAYLHCAKALMRSRLWHDEARVPRATLPTLGRMIGDQTGLEALVESQEDMIRRYQADL
jgi:PPOX class probable FMN-dependent enzyme